MILDLSKKAHIPLIYRYKKCKGIALVDKYLPELNPLNKMYIIDSLEDWQKVEDEFPCEMMTVRCDCPRGIETRLPNGQTFDRDRVKGYIQQAKTAVPSAVIMLEDMKEGTNERIHTQGAVCLDVRIGDYVYMDYVGPSFDCGEISKGKATHQTWNIPWEEVPFMKDTAARKFKVYEISQDAYVDTAKERITTLIGYYPDRQEEIIKTMPKSFTPMPIQMFRDIRDKVIFPLYIQHRELSMDGLRSFGVELNIVEDGTLVPMEIQVPERFVEEVER